MSSLCASKTLRSSDFPELLCVTEDDVQLAVGMEVGMQDSLTGGSGFGALCRRFAM